jgi:hypothetical protein
VPAAGERSGSGRAGERASGPAAVRHNRTPN